VTRLVDIGIAPYLVSGSVGLLVAQRLVRALCPHCKEAYTPDAKERELYHLKSPTLYRAKGCDKCRKIGYWGRMAIYEVLPVDEEIRRLITVDADLEKMRKVQKDRGYENLFQNGLKKVDRGLTTLEEILSVTYE